MPLEREGRRVAYRGEKSGLRPSSARRDSRGESEERGERETRGSRRDWGENSRSDAESDGCFLVCTPDVLFVCLLGGGGRNFLHVGSLCAFGPPGGWAYLAGALGGRRSPLDGRLPLSYR